MSAQDPHNAPAAPSEREYEALLADAELGRKRGEWLTEAYARIGELEVENRRLRETLVGPGTPHARMEATWRRMSEHEDLVEHLTGWHPMSSKGTLEVAYTDAFGKLVQALEEIAARPTEERNPDGDDQAAHTMQMIARETLGG